ncbi:MAG: general secretion pathway protein GspK, partial [Desulfobacteraceae bacterium]|nr:general secretion pathway protein GspK [Desulfobacteraceae bacterium]
MSNISLKTNSYKEGSVLVLVLIVLSSMTILSVGLAYRTRIEMKLAHANARRTQAYYLALGGIERIKALLSEVELSPSTITRICQFTGTAKEEGLFEQLRDYGLIEGKLLIYSVRDERGYLNINKSDPASWENMDSISNECCSSILDWIDADDDTSPDGAETDFYERLDLPYVSKNSPCVALKELLFLRGITRDIYIGEDLNRNSLLDENERDGQLQFPPDNRDNILDLGLVDIFTVYGDGKININTTSRAILAALPGLDEEVADILLTYRDGPDGQFGTDDDMCFTSTEDLANVEGLTELQIELLQQYCCFDSEYFRIFSYARLNS